MNHIAFTGHRQILTADLPTLARNLRHLAQTDYDTVWHTGGAIGFDLAAYTVGVLTNPAVLHVPFLYQARSLPESTRNNESVYWCEQATSCTPIERNDDKGRFQRRNEHMVDSADAIYAYYRQGEHGGTRNCVLYALAHGKTVIDILTHELITRA